MNTSAHPEAAPCHSPLPWKREGLCIEAQDGNVGLLNLARPAAQTMDNGDIIVTAVNAHASLAAEVARLREALPIFEDAIALAEYNGPDRHAHTDDRHEFYAKVGLARETIDALAAALQPTDKEGTK